MIFDLTVVVSLFWSSLFAYDSFRKVRLFPFVANVFIMALCIAVLTIRLAP